MMPNTPVTHAEQKTFEELVEEKLKRLADEDGRQNERLDKLEAIIPQMNETALQIKDLSSDIKNIAIEMKHDREQMNRQSERMNRQDERIDKQDERIDRVEGRDGEKFREWSGYIAASVIGGIATFLIQVIFGR